MTAGAQGDDVNAEVPREQRSQRERRPRNEEHRHEGKDHDGLPFYERKQAEGQRKNVKKGGHGKGNWGDDKKPIAEEGNADAAEETKEPRRERREKKEEPKPEPEEEYEEVGFTYSDYLKQKEEKSSNLAAAQTREHEKLNTKNLQHNQHEDLYI